MLAGLCGNLPRQPMRITPIPDLADYVVTACLPAFSFGLAAQMDPPPRRVSLPGREGTFRGHVLFISLIRVTGALHPG